MDNNEKKVKSNTLFESTDVDSALSLTGYGKFHAEIIVVCAISILTVGFQNGLSSYVFPAAQCELNLSSFQVGLLNVAFLIGSALSSFLWGILADISGRKKVLILTHLLNAWVTIICSVIPSISTLVICRFLNGFFIGAPGSIIFSYLAEFQPPKYRSSIVCYCGLFFTASWLLLPVMAYLILPIDINIKMGVFFSLTPWRLFLILIAIPEVVVGFWFMKLPESPKFLVAKGDVQNALFVLRQIYARNKGGHGVFPIKHLVGDSNLESSEVAAVLCNGKAARILRKVVLQIKTLFCIPLVTITMLTCCIMFANMFGVFGLGLWLPELFIRFQQYQTLHPNSTVTVQELSTLSQIKNQTCEPSFDSSVIQSTIAMAVTSLVFNAFCGWLSSKVHIKVIPSFSMFLGGLSALSIYWLTSTTENLVVACVFQATMVTANMTIGSVVVELFPTKVGGIAICLIMCAGRIGAICSNIVFGYLMDKHCEIPIFAVAIVVLLGAGLCLLIPQKKNSEKTIVRQDKYIRNNIEISVITVGAI